METPTGGYPEGTARHMLDTRCHRTL